MWPMCTLWLYGTGLALAPCFGPWWAWGGASLHGVAWWGPWVEVPARAGAAGGAGAGGAPLAAGGAAGPVRSAPLAAGGAAGPARATPLAPGFRGGMPAPGPGTPLSVLTGITPGFTGGTGAGAGTNPSGAPEAGGTPIG